MPDPVPNTQSQVDRNFAAFKERLPDLLTTHAGKIALLSDGEIVGFFDSFGDAMQFGLEKFGAQDRFSLQEVTDHTISLGIYSHAGVLH